MPPSNQPFVNCSECSLSFAPKEQLVRRPRARAAALSVERAEGLVRVRMPCSRAIGVLLILIGVALIVYAVWSGIPPFLYVLIPLGALPLYLGGVQLGWFEIVIDARSITTRFWPLPLGRTRRHARAPIDNLSIEEFRTRHGLRYQVRVTVDDPREWWVESPDEDHIRAVAEVLREAFRDVPRVHS